MGKNLALICGCLMLGALIMPAASSSCFAAEGSHSSSEAADFPPGLQVYDDADQSLPARLASRIEANPFNLVGTVIFLLAILHTFFSSKILEISHRLEEAHQRKIEAGTAPRNSVSHSSRLLHFLGEIEVVFGLWAIPLLLSVVFFFDWSTVVGYVSHTVNYTEPMFVVVIMTLA